MHAIVRQARRLPLNGRPAWFHPAGRFTTEEGDEDLYVTALDAKTGDVLWRKELGQPERDDAANSIAVQGSRVFVAGMITTEGGRAILYVTALDAKTGDVLSSWEPR